mgnify:CR=1 FL=1
MADVKRVYTFGNKAAEGNGKMRELLGGKGANLAEMANIGLPVPPGFTITCQTCMEYANAGNVWPEGALDTIAEYRADLEERMGKRLGDAEDPLLVSVRSGAPFSMPGMMDTVLNLGLNDESINGLIKQTDDHPPAIAAPEGPLATPSGKYEVFSKQAYNLSRQWDLTGGGYVPDDGRDQITGLPIWYENFEGFGDPLREEYPFQLIGHHTKTRTHSSYGNVPWMSSVAPQQCWINEGDAAALGINQDDAVIVSTERGRSQMTAKVTNRIMPGVVSVPQGAWYDPETRDGATIGDPSVLDLGGCISVLTSSRPTPISKGNGVHSNLCKIEKA